MSTAAAPIRIPQINYSYYVGEAMLGTIQQAVTFAVANGSGSVIIPQEYQGTDSISAVTGGNFSVFIVDERNGQRQVYYWFNNASYQPAAFTQSAGYTATGMPGATSGCLEMGYVPAGDQGNGSGNIQVYANPGEPMPSLNLTLIPEDGTGLFTFLRCALDTAGNPRNQSTTLEVYSSPLYPNIWNMWIGQTPDVSGNKGMYIWAQSALNVIDFQGATTNGPYNQTIRLNYLGGSVYLGANVNVTPDGTVNCENATVAADLNADAATFDTCIVDNSPVRTFANTPDGPGEGMVWPDIGIPVSLGSSWQSPSIDPTTIPRLNTPNTFTAVPQSITGEGATFTVRGNTPTIDLTQVGLTTSWNLSGGDGETSFTNVAALYGSGGFAWHNTWVGGGADPNGVLMFLDSLGNLTITTDFFAASVHARGTSRASVMPNSTWMDFSPTGEGRIVIVGPSAGTIAPFQIAGIDGAGGTFTEYCVMGGTGITTQGSVTATTGLYTTGNITAGASGIHSTGAIATDGGFFTENVSITTDGSGTFQANLNSTNLYVSGAINISNPSTATGATATVFAMMPDMPAGGFNWVLVGQSNSLGNSAIFGFNFAGSGSASNRGTVGLAGGQGANFDVSGNWTFAGTITAAGKSFRIPHPTKDGMDLIHGCPEGPEWAVYYRGEVIVRDGTAEVTLPDYFEALTRPEDRTVQLTQIFEDDSTAIIASNTFCMLMASRVKDGKFTIRASEKVAKVWWEVMAVRADVPQLEIETVKEPPRDATLPTAITGPIEVPSSRPIGSGTPEAGKPQPKTVRAGNAVATGLGRTRKPH